MKKNIIKQLALIARFVFFAIILLPLNIFASADEPEKDSCSYHSTQTIVPTITVNFEDCLAMQNCQFTVYLIDPGNCSTDTPVIDQKDFVYGQTFQFTNESFNNGWVKVCVIVKPGTHCGYPNSAPQCQCKAVDPNGMTFQFELCP